MQALSIAKGISRCEDEQCVDTSIFPCFGPAYSLGYDRRLHPGELPRLGNAGGLASWRSWWSCGMWAVDSGVSIGSACQIEELPTSHKASTMTRVVIGSQNPTFRRSCGKARIITWPNTPDKCGAKWMLVCQKTMLPRHGALHNGGQQKFQVPEYKALSGAPRKVLYLTFPVVTWIMGKLASAVWRLA